MLDNLKKASVALMLATLSEKTTLAKYSMPKARNYSYYQIKNEQEGVDLILTLSAEQNIDKELKKLTQAVWSELMGEYIVNDALLDKEDFLMNQVSKLFLKYSKTKDVSDYLDKIQIFSKEFNALNNEFLIVAGAEQTGVAVFNDLEYLKMNGYLGKLIDNIYRVIKEESGELLKDKPWTKKGYDLNIGESVKEKARLITYAVINNEVPYVFGTNKALGNTLSLFEAEDEDAPVFEMHTREGKEEVNKEFAKSFYDKYLKQIGLNMSNNVPIDTKGKVVKRHMLKNVNLENALQYVLAFGDSIQMQSVFGEDDLVTKAVALNVISILEEQRGYMTTEGVASFDLTIEEMDEMFDENYERVLSKDKTVLPTIMGVYKNVVSAGNQLSEMLEAIIRLEKLIDEEDEDDEDLGLE